jgi:hypothetical protein
MSRVCISAAAARRSMLLVVVRCGSVVEYIRQHASAYVSAYPSGRERVGGCCVSVLEYAACRGRDFSSICLVTLGVIARNAD